MKRRLGKTNFNRDRRVLLKKFSNMMFSVNSGAIAIDAFAPASRSARLPGLTATEEPGYAPGALRHCFVPAPVACEATSTGCSRYSSGIIVFKFAILGKSKRAIYADSGCRVA